MNIGKMKEIALEKIGKVKAHRDRETGHVYYHGLRTAQLAINLRKKIIPGDAAFDEILFVAGLFHDIGKGIEPHAETGYAIVKHIVRDYCGAAELELISEAVRLHCTRIFPNDYPFHIKILQDADILDHFGIPEIWLSFLYSAHEERSIDRVLHWYASDDYKKHVVRMSELLNYDQSKLVLNEKISFVDGFVDRMKREAEGGICLEF